MSWRQRINVATHFIMKTCEKIRAQKSVLLLMFLIGFCWLIDGRVTAQTFTILHAFTTPAGLQETNSDGAISQAGLVLSGNALYGTTSAGGMSDDGTIFKVNTDGSGFTNLYTFTAISGSFPFTNGDGANPFAGLILASNILYGVACNGGSLGRGTVFAINTDGTGFTNLHSFSYKSDGSGPQGRLVLSNNTLYGTTYQGGQSGMGTIFAVNTDGTDFTNLHNFSQEALNNQGVYTNSDGAYPESGLVLFNNTLYGTASQCGSFNFGTVFAVSTDGARFSNLHTFTATSSSFPYTNSDGANPFGGLILSSNVLFGTTGGGGSFGGGTVFSLNTDDTRFTNLYNFTSIATEAHTNSNGGFLKSGLVLCGNRLYGTTYEGGPSGWGTMFAVNTDGTDFINLYNFTLDSGWGPIAGLISSGNTLYGTTTGGGPSLPPYPGTVFSLSFSPRLTITTSGISAILKWQTNVAGFSFAGFSLQSATNLVSPVWTTESPAPTGVNGQNAVTNAVTGTEKFFRLSQ
jgi:uncharacterized repeat protein (TIGR03803 family)